MSETVQEVIDSIRAKDPDVIRLDNMLRDSIKEIGVQEPIEYINGQLKYGHRRLKICIELGIKCPKRYSYEDANGRLTRGKVEY